MRAELVVELLLGGAAQETLWSLIRRENFERCGRPAMREYDKSVRHYIQSTTSTKGTVLWGSFDQLVLV
jgi:hypothetical protein